MTDCRGEAFDEFECSHPLIAVELGFHCEGRITRSAAHKKVERSLQQRLLRIAKLRCEVILGRYVRLEARRRNRRPPPSGVLGIKYAKPPGPVLVFPTTDPLAGGRLSYGHYLNVIP